MGKNGIVHYRIAGCMLSVTRSPVGSLTSQPGLSRRVLSDCFVESLSIRPFPVCALRHPDIKIILTGLHADSSLHGFIGLPCLRLDVERLLRASPRWNRDGLYWQSLQ